MDISPTDSFDILADPRRRQLLLLLDDVDRDDRISLADLSERLAEEADGDESSRDVAISLHHHHLPKLEDAGLLAYDPATKTVSHVTISDEVSVADSGTTTCDD